MRAHARGARYEQERRFRGDQARALNRWAEIVHESMFGCS
jgi:hypothetical protein